MAGGINPIANLLGKVDANGALLVALAGGSGSVSALTVDTLTLSIANPDVTLSRASADVLFVSGSVVAETVVVGTIATVTATAGFLGFENSSIIKAPSNGRLTLLNNGSTDFDLLQIGGTGAAFPALRRAGTNLEVVLADASAYTTFRAQTVTIGPSSQVMVSAGAGSPEGVLAAAVGSLWLRTDPASLSTTLYIKTTGTTTNTGWSAVTIP